MDWITTDALPVAHIQSAGCKAQKKSVIGAHNRCWKYLIGAMTSHVEAKRSFEFIGRDKDRQLKHLREETRIGDILPRMKSRMRRKGFLRAPELIDKLPMTTMTIRSRKMTK